MARVRYLKSTLREVIYQVRFPKILKLTEGAPAAFQEMIMGNYPNYNVQKNETLVEVNGKAQQKVSENNHSFISQSGKTKINLTSTFIAISTLEYDRWEKLREEIETVLNNFCNCYNIAGIQRIGLRYRNIITRSKLALDDRRWAELLDSKILGPLENQEEVTTRFETVYEKKNSETCFTSRHFKLIKEQPGNELSFLLDCDYYHAGFFQKESVIGLSDELHDLSLRFIENSHKDILLTAMEPQELEEWRTI